MTKIYIPKRNQYHRVNIVSKKKPTFARKIYSGKRFTTYSVGSDTHYIPKRGITLIKS